MNDKQMLFWTRLALLAVALGCVNSLMLFVVAVIHIIMYLVQ